MTAFPHWMTAARAVGHAGVVDPAGEGKDKTIAAAQLDLITLCRRAIFERDPKFFIELGKCLSAMPKDDWGNDPYALAIVTAYCLIYFKNPAGKGMRLTKQDVCKLACTLMPRTKNYEAMRVTLFKKMRKVMPELESSRRQLARERSQSRQMATKRK